MPNAFLGALAANVLQRFGKQLHLIHRTHTYPAPFTAEVISVLYHDVLFFHRFLVIAFDGIDVEHHEACHGWDVGEF